MTCPDNATPLSELAISPILAASLRDFHGIRAAGDLRRYATVAELPLWAALQQLSGIDRAATMRICDALGEVGNG